MGTLRSHTDHSGMTVNGVLLGVPVDLDDDPTTHEWDDSAFPNGEIDAEGNITVDDAEGVADRVSSTTTRGTIFQEP